MQHRENSDSIRAWEIKHAVWETRHERAPKFAMHSRVKSRILLDGLENLIERFEKFFPKSRDLIFVSAADVGYVGFRLRPDD